MEVKGGLGDRRETLGHWEGMLTIGAKDDQNIYMDEMS